MPMYKREKLSPRKKLWGWDYNKAAQFCMTGKEWHEYVRRDAFKIERGGDTAYSGNGVEVWLDGKDINQQ